ncbi:hypothetical protein A3C09_04160 [Candidatus Uhrbacteria bacterium RIFCSPHIGHO2_02_FULL_47_44]|nr:MAG: hypothetical protein A2839_00280 [Candidatus Uhrbacteria bacterium RIFCSPHIGHO2_01_FULL_47_10]OGL71400.1 MAG: hypothetical protein A3C09_04160 [Candidatus Uhrbacteria bacterium RIFCSPHIGHO2_02_FULL_47_44]OGL76168.1 MAG: hypothetical protein A3E97_02960 [Candidatus Uhrbacteria bacterium RIFCSPHIGHO2_12_FULL_47_12]OGL92711.1 MAG: hypothetical protein A3H12_03510 [Candidatus Uhrbacteria bacterium RIFCSPLOWO2_12_FULL_47_9]
MCKRSFIVDAYRSGNIDERQRSGRFFFLPHRVFCDKIGLTNMKKTRVITKKMRDQAVAQSSKMEGLSLARARKNIAMIRKLKKYGIKISV